MDAALPDTNATPGPAAATPRPAAPPTPGPAAPAPAATPAQADTPAPSAADGWVSARKLLGSQPTASALRRLKPPPQARLVRLRCDRSLPFEFIDELLAPYLALWGAQRTTALSDYDPALSQAAAAEPADVRLFFLDWRLYADRLEPAAAAAFIAERASSTLQASGGRVPVLVNTWPALPAGEPLAAWVRALNDALAALPARLPGLYLVDLENAVRPEVPGDFFDARNDKVSKFPFSSHAAAAIARHLALDLLPSLSGERIKAVVLDLDDTLWRGVLGEDGPDRLELGPGHHELYRLLDGLRKRGTLLALSSRNELADVEAVFRTRRDLPLRLEDFAAVRVSWAPKAGSLDAIARDLNIHPSAMLFVDDNGSELVKAQGAVQGLRVLLADPAGVETARALRHYPGLYPLARDEAAGLRTEDIRKNREREKLRTGAGDLVGFLAALKMEVHVHRSQREHARRVHELSQKTNQFNLALARLSAAEAARAFGEDHVTATVAVQDALSDSGLVGVLIARVEGELATVREVLLSCRVLGREVELLALRTLCGWLFERGARRIRFDVVEGPRNGPARDWLARALPGGGREDSLVALQARLDELCKTHPARVVEHR